MGDLHLPVFPEGKSWTDTSTSFRSWRYSHHRFKGAEVAECSENDLPMKVGHIYYWPGDHISFPCKVCQRDLDSNGKIKTWGWAAKVYDFFDHYQKNKKLQHADVGVQFLELNSENNTRLNEFEGSGDSDPSYMSGNRIQAKEHGFLSHIRRQTFEQIGNTLHIHNAEAKSAGVYFCYDDAEINLVRYFYILHAMTPINKNMSNISAFETACIAAGRLTFGTLYIWQDLTKAFLNSLSSFFIIYMFVRRLIWVHNEFHGLIAFKLFIVWIYAINNSIVHWLPIVERWIYTDSCMYVYISNRVLLFKIVQYCCMISMSTTILLLLAERSLALHSQVSERKSQMITRAFILFEIVIFLTVTFKSIDIEHDEIWPILHPLEDTQTLAPLGNTIATAIICVDVPTMAYCLVLRTFCKRKLKTNHQSLQITYKLRYSLTVVDAFIPVIFFHGAVLLFNNISVLISPMILNSLDLVAKKNYHGLTNIMPYYTVIMPILYLYALRKLRER
ncbi:unnamed protein product, partial [Mesorhabditis belari]|uniref:Uncharacterized protein n=1 Tax=Mesorhabditis belari TaxID=2138241 RepID=A0AAF3FL76_9BILA